MKMSYNDLIKMPRKFDSRGWNRQFKWLPVSKRHPFPYQLPFIDDFSVAATVSASQKMPGKYPRRALGPGINPSDQGSPDKESYMKRVAEKRKASEIMSRAHKKQRMFPHYPQHQKTGLEKRTDGIFGAALLGAALYGGALSAGYLGTIGFLETQGGRGTTARLLSRGAKYFKLD